MPDLHTYRPRVLVADPDPETAVMLARQLEWAGYDVTTAGDAPEALVAVSRGDVDALVIDATMTGMSGYEAIRVLRAQPQSRLLPVLMVSSRAGKLDRDFAFTVGADDYVRKPFRCADLVARLALLVPSADAPLPQPIARRTRTAVRAPQPVLAGR
jgi:CheY-like chemotaxis protein